MLNSIEGHKGGSSTPSYRQAVANRGKKPIEFVRRPSGEERRNMEEDQDLSKSREDNDTKENEEEDKKQGVENEVQKGPCKPKAEVTPRVVLNDPTLQVQRDHMQTYAIIFNFM